MTLVPLVLFFLSVPAHAGTVELSGSRLRELLDVPKPPEPELPGPLAASREVTLVPVEGGLQVHATWTLRAARPGWFTGTLIGPGAHVGWVTWNGEAAALSTTSAGTILAGWVEEPVTVVLDAFVPAQRLSLLPAVQGRVHLDGEQALQADGQPALTDGTAWITPAADLARVPPPPAPDAGRLVLARDALGLTLGDAEVTGRAHLLWVVRRGKLDAVSIRVDGVGSDLAVDGANVASWTRSGDRVDVTLREPADDRVDLSLRWSSVTPTGTEAKLALPHVEPLGAFRTESTVQIAREEGLEVVPSLPGWTPIASSSIPDWGTGLVQGTPSASFRAAGVPGGRLDLLRFEPVDLPPAVVDVADYRVTTTREGRLLARALYEVRNQRAPWLRITPPVGWQIVGVRVGGDTARPVTDGGAGWLVPLPRSVQTVEGLISFTVEVTFLGEQAPWENGTRDLALPVLDADVADWRATVFLPPGWRSRNHPAEGSVVKQFARGEGISYGLGTGRVGAAEADETFQEAVTAWLGNDFEAAQDKIDDLRSAGVKGRNLDFLQSNLDLVDGKREDTVYTARQVRAQTRARASEQVVEQEELSKKAEKSKDAGDLAAAKRYYGQALEIGGTLAQLESDEQVEAKERNEQYTAEIDKLQTDMDQRQAALGDDDANKLPWNVKGPVDWNVEGKPDWNTSGRPEWEPPDEPDTGGSESGVIEGITVSGSGEGGYGAAAVGSGTIVRGATDRGGIESVQMEAKRHGPFSFLHGGRRRHRKPGPVSQGGLGESAGEPLPPPEVHASALSVIVPAIGVPVRFQRHLVPAGADEQVALAAHASKKTRSTP